MKRQLRIKVSGAVQGVFFRHSAKQNADALGLTGFVQNDDDGSVYAEVEGEEAKLEKFLEWCRKGPPLAKIEKIEFSFDIASGQFEKFEIQ